MEQRQIKSNKSEGGNVRTDFNETVHLETQKILTNIPYWFLENWFLYNSNMITQEKRENLNLKSTYIEKSKSLRTQIDNNRYKNMTPVVKK